MPGLDMLPITTVLNGEKLTRMVTGHLLTDQLWRVPLLAADFRGYEIHLGETHVHGGAAFSSITRVGEGLARFDGSVVTMHWSSARMCMASSMKTGSVMHSSTLYVRPRAWRRPRNVDLQAQIVSGASTGSQLICARL
jgi:hypothetical protein